MSFYRKYRPRKFAALVGENHVRDTLLKAISESKVSHGYLFAGPRGIGKTTAARLLAKAVNCQKRQELSSQGSGEPCDECDFCREVTLGKSLDIVEIDAASNRGIEEIRDLRDKVKFAPSAGKFKIFIIDEVHMLTLPAFNALLKTLEEPPAHAIFILATTEVHKVPATILSRVQRFDFRRIAKDDIISNLKLIANSEKLKVEEAALEAIALAAEGSHRDAISLLEQVASLTANFTLDDVRSVLGLAKSQEVVNIIADIIAGQPAKALEILSQLLADGVDSAQLIKELTESWRQILLLKISDGLADFETTKEIKEKLMSLADKLSTEKINKILSIFIESGRLIKETSIRSLPIEMAIVEACGLIEDTRNKIQETNISEIRNPKSETSTKLKTNSKPEVKEEISKKNSKAAIEQSNNPPAGRAGRAIDLIDEKLWREILDKIKPHNHSLNALLRDAYPEGIEGDKLILSVKFKFHHDKISEAKNCQIIEEVLQQILGKKLKVVCRITDGKRIKSEKPPIEKSGKDLEKAAKEIFETE